VRRYPCHVIAQNVAREVGYRGPVAMLPNACAAGNYAVACATELLRSGRADRMLAGGRRHLLAHHLLRLCPSRCRGARPLPPVRSRSRKGMIPGEGAAVLVLEPLDLARERGATIYAEVAGYGLSCDAHHMTGAQPSGDGALRAMELALAGAGAAPPR
jgi:3-oxoacyl-[acyl-carrier-protein] synthase II